MRFISCLFILLAVVVLTSCSIQRRNYRNGFYIDWKNSSSHTETFRKTHQPRTASKKAPVTEVLVNANAPVKNITASIDEKKVWPSFTGIKTFTDNCDTLFFRDGTVVLAKVNEIGLSEVKYKHCDNQDGPMYVAEKNKIDFIVYSNGQTERFKVEQVNINDKYNNRDEVVRKAQTMSKTSMVYSIVGLVTLIVYFTGIIMAVAALIKAYSAMRYIRKNNINDEKAFRYIRTARGFAIATLIIGFIFLTLIALVLLITAGW